MKIYVAIGHYKGSENIICVATMQATKKAFVTDCNNNSFVTYVVMTETMLARVVAADKVFGVYDLVKKMTSNYRIWDDVTDYLTNCIDIIVDKVESIKNNPV